MPLLSCSQDIWGDSGSSQGNLPSFWGAKIIGQSEKSLCPLLFASRSDHRSPSPSASMSDTACLTSQQGCAFQTGPSVWDQASQQGSPQFTLAAIVCPFTKKIARYSPASLQSPLVLLLRLCVAEVSFPGKTRFFLKL